MASRVRIEAGRGTRPRFTRAALRACLRDLPRAKADHLIDAAAGLGRQIELLARAGRSAANGALGAARRGAAVGAISAGKRRRRVPSCAVLLSPPRHRRGKCRRARALPSLRAPRRFGPCARACHCRRCARHAGTSVHHQSLGDGRTLVARRPGSGARRRRSFSATGASETLDSWVSGCVRLFEPQVRWLLRRRDQRLRELSSRRSREAVLEDRRIECLSQCRISLCGQIAALQTMLDE